jgi:hypothetical protein
LFFAPLAKILAMRRLKAFDRNVRQGIAKREEQLPKGVGENANASRASKEAHWKGDSRRVFPACLFSFL